MLVAKKRKQIHEYESRLEIFEGKMGAGKSYFAVRRMFEVLTQQARPIYTNLPIKWRVLRKYMRDRHGDEIANLVHELTERHWRAFLRRQHQFAEFKVEVERLRPCDMKPDQLQELHAACEKHYAQHPPSLHKLAGQEKLFVKQIIAWFDYKHGAPIYDGPDANHIPPSAVIIIDEVQKWHPMLNQSRDKDREYLLSYITMSRHHAHWIWVLTQDAMNISIEFRRLAHHIWTIWNRYEDEILGPLRFKHLGMRAMGYARFSPDEYAKQQQFLGTDKKKLSIEMFTIITTLPWSKLIYRFYSSETHLGSRRQLQKTLEEGRKLAGVTSYGHDYREKPKDEEMKGISVITKLYALLGVIIIAAGAFVAGQQTVERKNAENQTEQYQPISWPEWSMVSTTPWIAGKPHKKGDIIAGTPAKLLYISDDRRSLVLDAHDHFWLWDYGSDPLRVGPKEDVRTAVAGILAGRGNGPRPTDTAD